MFVYIAPMFFLSMSVIINTGYSTDSTQFPLPTVTSIQVTNDTNCTGFLDDFAIAASEFTKCSIKHARPVTLCAECIDQYMTFYSKYQDLIGNKTCKSLFISHDRLNAVLEYHDSILAVWDKGNCYGCFDWNQGKPMLSNSTRQFQDMLKDTTDCINNTPGNNTEVCENCFEKYVQLDEFYKNLSIDSIGVDTVCMDIVDSMNATRSKWSKDLNCCSLRRSPEIVFLCCSAVIAALPLLFYVAVRFWGPIRDLPNVLKQSRFKQVILRFSEGGNERQD